MINELGSIPSSTRKELHQAAEKERLSKAERERGSQKKKKKKKEIISKECIVLGNFTFFMGMERDYQQISQC